MFNRTCQGNNFIITYLMKQEAVVKRQPTKLQKVYSFCKNAIAVLITIVALIPIIYLLGSDDSYFPIKPLFAAYSEDAYFQAKVAEIEAAFNSSQIVNLHTLGSDKKEDSVRDWEHLQEFVRYLGFRFNRNQLATVNRLIFPPQVRQKKGKSLSPESQQQVEKAYALSNSGDINALRNKLNKVALNTIARLKIKQKDVKSGGFGIVDEVFSRKIWIITIHPDNWQFHSAEALRKQLTLLSKEREKDRFVVVSVAPADSEWKRIKSIPISINESVFSSIKTKLKQIIKASLPYEINSTRLIEAVLCQYNTSLFRLNNFLQSCNSTYSCYNSIRLLSTKSKKQQNTQLVEMLNELCSKGHINEEDQEFKVALSQLGFYNGQEEAEDNIKLYFDIALGKKCKGSRYCTFEWLKSEPKSKQQKANQTKSPQSPQRQFKPIEPKQATKQSNKQKDITQQIPIQVVVASQNKTKHVKAKAEKRLSKQQDRTKSKNEDQKKSNKNKQKQTPKSEKAKDKPKKTKQTKTAKDLKVQQSPKLPCNQDLQIDQTLAAEDVPQDTSSSKSEAATEASLQIVEDKVAEESIEASHEVAVCAQADQSCNAAQTEQSNEEVVQAIPDDSIIPSEPETPLSEQAQTQATETVANIQTSSQTAQLATTQSDAQNKEILQETKQQVIASQSQQVDKQQSSKDDNVEQTNTVIQAVQTIQITDSIEDKLQGDNDEQVEADQPEQAVVVDVLAQADLLTQANQQVKDLDKDAIEIKSSQPADPIQSGPETEDAAPQLPNTAQDIAEAADQQNQHVEINQTPTENSDVIE